MIILQVATWAHVVGAIIRILLVLTSFRWPDMSKVYFHFEVAMLLIDQGLVTSDSSDAEDRICLLTVTIVALCHQYYFLPSFAAIAVKQVFYSTLASYLFRQPLKQAVSNFFLMLTQQVAVLIINQIIINTAGQLVTEAECLREDLFDEHHDAVVIIDQKSNQVRAINRRATESHVGHIIKHILDEPVFAPCSRLIDKKAQFTSHLAFIKQLNELDHSITLRQIIESEAQRGFSGQFSSYRIYQ